MSLSPGLPNVVNAYTYNAGRSNLLNHLSRSDPNEDQDYSRDDDMLEEDDQEDEAEEYGT